MKNKYYIVKDKKNEIYVDAFVAISDDIAKQLKTDQLKQIIYLKKNSKNIAEQAQTINGLSNATNYELVDANELTLIDYKEAIKELEKK